MMSRKACGVLTIREMEAERQAKETQQIVETAKKERRKALYGKVSFVKLPRLFGKSLKCLPMYLVEKISIICTGTW